MLHGYLNQDLVLYRNWVSRNNDITEMVLFETKYICL